MTGTEFCSKTPTAKSGSPFATAPAQEASRNQDLHGTHSDGTFRQAVILHEQGRVRDAVQLYQRILGAEPDHFGCLHYLGLIYAQQNQYDEAIVLLHKALDRNPNSADTHVNLAVIFETINRPQEAIAHCRKALAIKTDFAEAHFITGNAFKALDRFEEAVIHFQKAIEIRPAYIEAHYNLANVLSAHGRKDRALEHYGKALALRPLYPKALNNRGIVLQEDKHHEDALKDFDRAVAIKPDYFEALINRGNTLLALARQQDALVSFDKALSLEPYDAGAVYGRGIALQDAEQVQYRSNAWRSGQAIAHHGKAIALRAIDLPRSTKCLEEALLRLVEAGALSAVPQPPQPTRYPSALYPDALRAVMNRLDAAGIEAFLTGGTLLGAMRHRDFLDFDKDLDFGIRGFVKANELRRALEDDPDFELSWEPTEEAPLVAYYWRDKVAIDFFRFFWESDHVWCGLDVGGHSMKWRHHPFELVDFHWHNVRVKVPADADRFLTETYGDWRVPNPYFGLFASPNIEGGFPPISRNVAYSAIVQALSRNEAARAIDLCRQVLALDPDNSVISQLSDELVASNARAASPSNEMRLPGSLSLGQAFDDLPG
jgi:tetratricopeptide (TPR) repeat protein